MNAWFMLYFFEDNLVHINNLFTPNTNHANSELYNHYRLLFSSKNTAFFNDIIGNYKLKNKVEINNLDYNLFNVRLSHSQIIEQVYPENEIPVYCEIYLNIDYLKSLINSRLEIPNYLQLCLLLKDRGRYYLRNEKLKCLDDRNYILNDNNYLNQLLLNNNLNIADLTQYYLNKILTINKQELINLLPDDIIKISNDLYFKSKDTCFLNRYELENFNTFSINLKIDICIHNRIFLIEDSLLEDHFNSFFKSKTTLSPIFINIKEWNRYTCEHKLKIMATCLKIYNPKTHNILTLDYFYGIQRNIIYYIPYIKYYSRLNESKYFQHDKLLLLKPDSNFYQAYNNYLSDPSNTELDYQILKTIGAYKTTPFITNIINLDKDIASELKECPICLEKCDTNNLVITSCQHYLCIKCVFKLFKNSSIYHSLYSNDYKPTKILEKYTACVPVYCSTQNQDYSTKETIFFNDSQLSFSCPICRNIVPDTCIFNLNKPKKTNLSRSSNKRKPSLKDKSYLLYLKNLLLKNGNLDYKTEVIINNLFKLRLKYNSKTQGKITKSKICNMSNTTNDNSTNDNNTKYDKTTNDNSTKYDKTTNDNSTKYDKTKYDKTYYSDTNLIVNEEIYNVKNNNLPEMNTLIIYVSLSNSWNKFIDNLSSYLFKGTSYYILPICLRNDLDSEYMLTIFKMLIKKNISKVDVYYPQNFYSNHEIVSSLLIKLNMRFMIFNYLNQIDKLINNNHPNQSSLISKSIEFTNINTIHNNINNDNNGKNNNIDSIKKSIRKTISQVIKNRSDEYTLSDINNLDLVNESIYVDNFNLNIDILEDYKYLLKDYKKNNMNFTNYYLVIKKTIDEKIFKGDINFIKETIEYVEYI
jgi:hypothetical protein